VVRENIKKILRELPKGVQLVAAVKTRTPAEILDAVTAGVSIIGENYVQEAAKTFKVVGPEIKWHLIGHLQSNKAKKAVEIFDMIETVDSLKVAAAIDKACRKAGKTMSVLIEINSAEEPHKAGVMPEDAVSLIKDMSVLENIKIMGLMTMGPFSIKPEELRPYFRITKALFEEIKAQGLPRVKMTYLSMGMSDSYRVAIEEGATLVRIGTGIFGKRNYG
jgi:pyridoxal phosphate enzyme (YggS family)